MSDKKEQDGKKKSDIGKLKFRLPSLVQIQLKDRPPWIAQPLNTGMAERYCTEVEKNDTSAEVARAFVTRLVRERPADEREQITLSDLPPLSEKVIRDLTDGELDEIARQYLEASSAHINSEIDSTAPPLDRLKEVLLARARIWQDNSKKMLERIKGSASFQSLFGSRAVADLARTQASISAMQDHARGLELNTTHKFIIPDLPPLETTGQDMLSELQGLARSSNEQLALQNSQREQLALQSQTLADMNTSLVALAEGTTDQAAKAKLSARWALGAATLSFVITAGGVFLNHHQSKLDTELQSRAIDSEARSMGTLIQLLESSIEQQSATRNQAASNQAKNEADNQEFQKLLREMIELQRQQQEKLTAE